LFSHQVVFRAEFYKIEKKEEKEEKKKKKKKKNKNSFLYESLTLAHHVGSSIAECRLPQYLPRCTR
jgi:hypothetical protein